MPRQLAAKDAITYSKDDVARRPLRPVANTNTLSRIGVANVAEVGKGLAVVAHEPAALSESGSERADVRSGAALLERARVSDRL